MKKYIIFLLLVQPLLTFAQVASYQITSYNVEGTKAPNTHYLGTAWLNTMMQENNSLPYNITKATFKANSTLDWHKHATPQTLIVVEGRGYYQEKGKDPIVIKQGDILVCDKDIEHWHASSKENNITYLALYGGKLPTIWTEVLTQEYYDNVAEKLKNK
ncbi:cupin domain-containing protein [Flavobacterium sp. F-328]|uniref:Cupin domain-containing protein n=1 Tax=Flavobacterium erciyesense TaxID=2825842 RepID=A0ABS5D640_9FLAO|nr:cupin domain-containing protein [Flavobacterium erciyesense]MBQ0909486.1 cupin domain-containing protein [Flavobacterium erciyesense]